MPTLIIEHYPPIKKFSEIGLETASRRTNALRSVTILTYTICKNQVSALFILAGKTPKFTQKTGLFPGSYCVFCRSVIE
jgi:hypothetical protein